ncbi:UNVERIFIED_CONTAM: hypothetical protein Slati_2984200 [Sesamum latifolium]|uniref:Uncharacterized protein n=1 Tax=Sesamum latifolium TaxID=2727402 RepID=A0AAW2VEC1_9LAMI
MRSKGWRLSNHAKAGSCLNSTISLTRDRALTGCPWNFDKHVVILNSIRVDENPMKVDLSYCDLFVHIHDLPLSRMNLGVATLTGNKLGLCGDKEMDEEGFWGATLRIRVGLDVNKPLKRALKIKATMGEEYMFQEGFVDPGDQLPYGPWLCEPIPTRSRVLQGSMTRFSEGHQSTAPQRRDSKRGQEIFGEFGSRSGSITPPNPKVPATDLARDEDLTPKDLEVE